MARYDYQCPQCGFQMEQEHRMDEAPQVFCPQCSFKKCVYMKKVLAVPYIRVEGGTRRVV